MSNSDKDKLCDRTKGRTLSVYDETDFSFLLFCEVACDK